jgi:Uma2 family endonuclease
MAMGGIFGQMFGYDRGEGGPGGWWLAQEPELHLGSHVLVPDLAGWRRERMPRPPKTAACEIAPDWICEILSPRTRATDRIKKLPIYATHEVSHAWLVDPEERSLEIYRLEHGHWLLVAAHGADEVVRAEPFDAVELKLRVLWPFDDEQ